MELRTVSYHGVVSVTAMGHPSPGCVNADHLGDGKWWVARVFVRKEHRQKGLGKSLVMAMIAAVKSQGGTLVEVCPGGYDVPYSVQEKFYLSCGFQIVKPGVLHYKVT